MWNSGCVEEVGTCVLYCCADVPRKIILSACEDNSRGCCSPLLAKDSIEDTGTPWHRIVRFLLFLTVLYYYSLSLYEKLAELGENAIQSRRTVPYDFRRAPTDVSVKMACISWM